MVSFVFGGRGGGCYNVATLMFSNYLSFRETGLPTGILCTLGDISLDNGISYSCFYYQLEMISLIFNYCRSVVLLWQS